MSYADFISSLKQCRKDKIKQAITNIPQVYPARVLSIFLARFGLTT